MKKSRIKYVLIIAGAIITVIYAVNNMGKEKLNRIKRPDYNTEAGEYDIVMERDGNKTGITVKIPARELPDSRIQEAFDSAYEEIISKMPGENESLTNVTQKLNLINEAGEYGIKAEYYTDSYGIIDSYGNVYNTELEYKTEVMIYAELSYKKMMQRYEIPVVVYPAELSDKELLNNYISEYIESQDKDSDYVVLPEIIGGEEVAFYKSSDNTAGIITFAAAVIFAVIYGKKRGEPKKRQEKRNRQMMMDYSEIVSKLSLLMGAGMSSYNAIKRIVKDYDKSMHRYAYEELAVCMNMIDSGIPETQAYNELGRRCNLHPYIKLGNYLSRNINKGNRNIFELLKEEARDAFEDRKSLARKNGEEAGTRLLGPMIMMLGVVLVIVTVPAFMSM